MKTSGYFDHHFIIIIFIFIFSLINSKYFWPLKI